MADEQQPRAGDGSIAPGDQAPPATAAIAYPSPSAVASASATQEAHDDEEEKAAAPAATCEQDNAEVAPPSSTHEAPLVTVNLKFIHHERLSVQCARTILVSELKKRVLELYARHVEEEAKQNDDNEVEATSQRSAAPSESDLVTGAPLRLIYKGKVLKDDLALAAYNFVDDDTIHAVFGRPQTSVSEAATSGAGPTATSSATATRNDSTGEVTTTTNGIQDLGNGVVLGRFSFDTGENSPLPEIGSFLNTILSTFASGAGPEGTTTSVRITTSDLPASVASTASVASSTTVAASTPPPSAPMSSASTTASATAASTAGTSSASTPAATSPTSPASITAIRYSIPIGPTQAPSPSPSPSTIGYATSLLNQAASLRRTIPALELSPLSQPPELSGEMYALGNAMREAGDTFLAVHRQLQFVATRFLSENNLNESERLRLRTRVHQLVSILNQVGSLSRAVSDNLAVSSYGPRAQTLPAQTSQPASQMLTQHPPTTATTTPASQSTPSVSVSPTVNIFSGGNAPGADASNVGNSIAEILQAVGGLVGGATSTPTNSTNQQSGVPGNLGSLLNLVSALSSNGVRPGQSMVPPNGSGVQGPPVPPSPSPPASVFPGNLQQPANTNQQTTTAASISSQPLSALFTQVMRDMNTLDEWDPETAEDLLKRVYPHLCHRVRSLFSSPDNSTVQILKKKWCENAVDEIESAMRRVFESHALLYTRDRLRCRINEAALEHLLKILLDVNTHDSLDQTHIIASLDKLRFCMSVHVDISEETSPIEAVRIASNVTSSILTTEDLSVRRYAETLARRVKREITSLLKTRTA